MGYNTNTILGKFYVISTRGNFIPCGKKMGVCCCKEATNDKEVLRKPQQKKPTNWLDGTKPKMKIARCMRRNTVFFQIEAYVLIVTRPNRSPGL